MASPEKTTEFWECNLQGQKTFRALGTRDVLILVSSELGGADIVARKKGELTQQDKDRLTSEGIPQHCWEDDAMIMKERYSKDKEYKSIVIEDTPHMSKQNVLDKISSLFKHTTQHGVVLNYIGPGKIGTGDWCFSDGFISFTNIAELYVQHFTGRAMIIHCDCSYSGQWVESCKKFLDTKGVQPCGHSARNTGIKMKVFCSCQPDQIGYSLLHSVRACHNDKNQGTFYLKSDNTTKGSDQVACGADFTVITCDEFPEDECALFSNYTFQEKTRRGMIHIVKGIDGNRPAWYYVQLKDDPETIRLFKEKLQDPEINLTDYGTILKSGFGQEPPQEVRDWGRRILNGLEDLLGH